MSRFRLLLLVLIVACLGGAAALWDHSFTQTKPKQARVSRVVPIVPPSTTEPTPPNITPSPEEPVDPQSDPTPAPERKSQQQKKAAPRAGSASLKKQTIKPVEQPDDPDVVTLEAASQQGARVPKSFIGFSLETWTIPKLAGRGKTSARPMVRLARALGGNGPVHIRVGGDSQDRSWWLEDPRRVPAGLLSYRQKPLAIANAMPAARGSEYFTTPQWIDITTRFIKATGGPAIIGLNLAENNPIHVASFARAVYRKLPRRQLQAFEVGNEPSLYWRFPASWKRKNGKLWPSSKKRNFTFSQLVNGWQQYSNALRHRIGPNVPLAGTALGCPGMRWCDKSDYFYNRFRSNMRVATMHVYAIRQPADPQDRINPAHPLFPSIRKLLQPVNTTGISKRVADQIQTAHRAGLPIRLDEFNTTPFGGAPGVSDRFAAALWAPEAMFSMRKAGLDGVNFHFGYGTSYRPFWINWSGNRPRATVAPVYYGMYFFSRAIQNGARLLPLKARHSKPGISTWLLKDRHGNFRLAVINKGTASSPVSLRMPRHGTAHLARLSASSLETNGGIKWAGQSFGPDGLLHGRKRIMKVKPKQGTYTVSANGQSALILTIPAAK